MHILVLGGNGFIGSHFVPAAVDAGCRVTVLDLTPSPRYPHGRPFEFIEAGIGVLSAMPGILSNADVVCHFVYTTVPSTSNADPTADITDNLIASVRLLETMRTTGPKRIVYLSSGGAVYGRPKTTPISEDHPLDPISSYGVTKVAFEKYLGMYASVYGLRPTIIRPANPYGPGQGKVGILGAINTFLHAAAFGETATIWGDGSLVRDYVFIEDLSSLLVEAIKSDKPGIYNCGFGSGTSLLELLAVIQSVTKRSICRDHKPARAFDPQAVVLDVSRARDAFGWTPRVSLLSGVARTWEWMLRQT